MLWVFKARPSQLSEGTSNMSNAASTVSRNAWLEFHLYIMAAYRFHLACFCYALSDHLECKNQKSMSNLLLAKPFFSLQQSNFRDVCFVGLVELCCYVNVSFLIFQAIRFLHSHFNRFDEIDMEKNTHRNNLSMSLLVQEDITFDCGKIQIKVKLKMQGKL